MRIRERSLTPVAAVVAGLLAGVVGTVCMDTFRYLAYRRTGGKDSPLAWEFAPVESWAQAPDPGQIAKRVVEGFTQHELPDRWAFPASTAAHWGYGSGWGALYGIVAGSLHDPRPLYGLPFGAAVWSGDYAVLPLAGLYKPIWQYDAKTLTPDLVGHLIYGLGTGTAFWLITRWWSGVARSPRCAPGA
ncbi:hypothetical protein [Catellatospora citrea]|uniref:DUF1440 domain-containing protein n=1 Tax=Catellatospora citrea TaxID=53366 RepID=A0A8J3KSR5_9ACTN|nr:hypothetical protein [Catellatospora citrea]RKE06231.1 hypothetical protein C8E86_1050 [Catellatospora citrea]GIG00570.1 hypothetical protein Cci01nite_56630 [Catellatospora citrea]